MALADAVLVSTGAIPGAWLRFYLVNHFQPMLPRKHWATAGVNLLACLALGLLLSLGDGCSDLHRLQLLLSVGFLGSFSTFSTFVVELLQALGEGEAGEALGLAGLSVAGGVLALELGRWLGGL
jgi:CrcB protein